MAKKSEERFGKLEAQQRETNRRLGRIEDTLGTASRVFELMEDRLGRLEDGQNELVESHKALVLGQRTLVRVAELMEGRLQALEEGQKALVLGQGALIQAVEGVNERLDLLVKVTTRDRT